LIAVGFSGKVNKSQTHRMCRFCKSWISKSLGVKQWHSQHKIFWGAISFDLKRVAVFCKQIMCSSPAIIFISWPTFCPPIQVDFLRAMFLTT